MAVNITYRTSEDQAEIAQNEAVNKGSPLRNVEIDGNFKSIKQAIDNLELSGSTTISINPIYNLAATTIQEAIEELSSGATELATELTDLSSGVAAIKNIVEGNVGDYGSGSGSGFVAPRPATTITINPIPGLQSTGVQDAIEELSSGKQPTLVSGNNIKTLTSGTGSIDLLGSGQLSFKTINNESILGSGNISITGGGATGATQTFKTINNQSIIGTGDIVISGSIDDTASDGELYKTWSADKIFDSISAAKQAVKEEILGGATGAYDTLQELYDVMNGVGTGSMSGSGADITTAVVTNLASKENAITPKQTGYLTWNSGANGGSGDWEFKNEVLLNSTNIKTINGNTMMSSSGSTDLKLRSIAGYSIIGTGDIAVAALLDDVTASGSTWSSKKISSEITSTVNTAISNYIPVDSGGGAGGGDVTKTGTETLTNKTIQGLVEMSVNLDQLPLVSDRTKFNLNNGNLFIKQIDAATIFTVVNPTATGTALSFIVELRNTQTTPPSITWMPNTRWAGGTVPTLTAKTTGTYAIDIFGFYSFDNGSTWRGLVLAKNVW